MKVTVLAILLATPAAFADISVGARTYSSPLVGITVNNDDGSLEVINPGHRVSDRFPHARGIVADESSAQGVCAAVERQLVTFTQERLFWWFRLSSFNEAGQMVPRDHYWQLLTVTCR